LAVADAKLRRNLGAAPLQDATPDNENNEALQAAFRQVGEFLYHFSLLEQEIDTASVSCSESEPEQLTS
jgi:hypothetical protein